MSGFNFGSSASHSTSPFGSSGPSFSFATSSSLFGSSAPATSSTAFGAGSSPFGFSSNPASSSPAFGTPIASPTPNPNPFPSFGVGSSVASTTTSPFWFIPSTAASGSAPARFGLTASTFLLGASSSAQALGSTAPLFGSSLFGSTASASNSSPLFRSAPASSSPLYGTTGSSFAPSTGSALFGSSTSSAAPPSSTTTQSSAAQSSAAATTPSFPRFLNSSSAASTTPAFASFSTSSSSTASSTPAASSTTQAPFSSLSAFNTTTSAPTSTAVPASSAAPSSDTTTSSFTGFSLTTASSSGPSFGGSLAAASSSQAQPSATVPAFVATATATTTTTGTSTPAAQTSTALAVASTSGTTVSMTTPKLPSEITGKTVEEIIKEWNAELQERTGKFQKQANAIADWDRRILQNCDVLLRLEIEVANVVNTQAKVERQLKLIETHQDEALQSIEQEAERIYQDERGLLLNDEAASTRDAMYDQAEYIERELEQVTEQIKSIIETVNANQGGEVDANDGIAPLDVVVKILNNQLSSLMWTDEKVEPVLPRTEKEHESHPFDAASEGEGLVTAALVNMDVPSHVTALTNVDAHTRATTCPFTSLLGKAQGESLIDLEARFNEFTMRFDAKGQCSNVTIDDFSKPLSGDRSSFEDCKVSSEFISPLQKFACKYGEGRFSGLLAAGKSLHQKQVLLEYLGQLLYSMESEEVKTEETFLAWRDACHDIVDWGLNVGFICTHLKEIARSYFGLKPLGLEERCGEIRQLATFVLTLKNELAHAEEKLRRAEEDFRVDFSDVTPWTSQSRASHGLY